MWTNSVASGDAAPEVRRLKILIAEDHPGTQRALQSLLRWLGCVADVVDDGGAAVEAVRTREYDIVLMDIAMPGMDGVEATRRIRRDRALTPQPRVVGMSADTMPEDREICLAAGMDEFLPKPIEVQRLVRILDEASVGLSAAC